MNESKKLVPAAVKASEQRAEAPQRSYRAPQVHNLGSLEQVQGGVRFNLRDGPGTISYYGR
jgi:hypothetical protein